MKTLRYRQKHRNATGVEYLDRLIGEEGIKTNVSVGIPPTVFVYGGLALFIGIVGAIVVSKAITQK